MAADDPQRITPMQRVCNSFFAQGLYDEALPYCLQTVEIARSPAVTRPESLSSALNGLANVYLEMGELELALQFYIESQQIDINELGADHPWTAISTSNVGYTYRKMKRFDEALAAYEHALEVAEKVWPPEHPDTIRIKTSIQLVYRISGRFAEAEAWVQPALAEFERTGEAGRWAFNDLPRIYEAAQQFDKMLATAERFLVVVRQENDPHSVVEAQDLVLRALVGLQKLDEAKRRLDAFVLENESHPEREAESAPLVAMRAYLLSRAGGDTAVVAQLFDEAIDTAGHHEAELRLLRARALARRGDIDAARAEVQQAVNLGFEGRIEDIPGLAGL